MRIYYNNEYIAFLERHDLDIKNNLILLPLYPILIYNFLKETFDDYIINMFFSGNIMKAYFYIASFL